MRRVKRGEFESGVDPQDLEAAPFVVVFDLDETLYDQYYSWELGETCHSFVRSKGDGSMQAVQLAPGWEAAFSAIRELGGAIALYSANVDEVTLGNASAWTWEGKRLTEHPDILGVLSNSYLILQEKSEGTKPAPVSQPSKDLRIFDESLDKVILVDDNPRRVFQHANLRVTRKFHADHWCDPDTDDVTRSALGGELDAVVAEIRETRAWQASHPEVTFARAFLPYTMVGRLAVDALVSGAGLTREEAIAWVREHPDASDTRF